MSMTNPQAHLLKIRDCGFQTSFHHACRKGRKVDVAECMRELKVFGPAFLL